MTQQQLLFQHKYYTIFQFILFLQELQETNITILVLSKRDNM